MVDSGYGFDERYDQWNNVFGHYWWGRGVPQTSRYEANEVVDFQITFGALPNHNCVLGSLDMYFPSPPNDVYDDSLMNRFEDPGAGAYSYHRGRIFYTREALPAGSEIFLSYGYCSRQDLENPSQASLWYPEWAQFIPMREDFEAASQATLTVWNKLLSRHGYDVDSIPDGSPLPFEGDRYESLTSHARSLLPTNTSELKTAMSSDRHKLKQNLARQFGTTQRSAEWVRENGLCIENLIPGPSTLPQAGQGGIAQHRMKAGEIVVPVPLLHIMDKSVLYLIEDMEEQEVSDSQQQLLTNYCFSHRHSSLMLCPTSNAILVNHCSTRTKECGEEGPNAAIRWASPDWDPRTEVSLKASLEDMAPNLDRLLAMEIVALRDINPGDEVFIDYGEDWEKAWEEHVEEWEPERPDEEDFYFSIAEANNQAPNEPLEHLVSNSVRGEESDHPYIFTGCLYWPTELDDHEVFVDEEEVDFDELSDDELIQTYGDDGSFFRLDSEREKMQLNYWPCAVLYQEEGDEEEEEDEDREATYLVRITQHPSEQRLPWHENEVPRFLYNYPRSSIHYFAKPYQSDVFMSNAFRHPIGIPDDMMPQQWLDLL